MKFFLFFVFWLLSVAAWAFDDSILHTKQWVWVLYQKAQLAYQKGLMTQALEYLGYCYQVKPVYPEVDSLIGYICMKQGAFTQAQYYYNIALNHPDDWTSSLKKYQLYYDVAQMYAMLHEPDKEAHFYSKIIDEDPEYHWWKNTSLQTILNILEQRKTDPEGLSYLVYLYDYKRSIYTYAHQKQGFIYYQNGHYSQAIKQYLFVVISSLVSTKKGMLDVDPGYEFVDVNSLLKNAQQYKVIEEFIDSSQLYRNMYFLASSFIKRNQGMDRWVALNIARSIIIGAGVHSDWGKQALNLLKGS